MSADLWSERTVAPPSAAGWFLRKTMTGTVAPVTAVGAGDLVAAAAGTAASARAAQIPVPASAERPSPGHSRRPDSPCRASGS